MPNNDIYKLGPPFAFRFRPPNGNAISEIADNYIWFSDRDSLNDPFDSNPEFIQLSKDKKELEDFYQILDKNITDERTKEYLKGIDLDRLLEIADDKIKPFISSFGIACFSMHPINMPLWASYSQNHQGVCLQFDTSRDNVFFHNVLPVIYVEAIKKRDYHPASQPDGIVDLFYKKTESWSYEKELRLLKESPGKVHYKKSALRNVILGFKAKDEFINNVLD